MITEELELNTYNAAYSNMPIKLSSDKASLPNFNYITNICYNTIRIKAMSIYIEGTKISTKLHTIGHRFKKGDNVLIYAGQYLGYYNILKVIDDDYVVIDLILEEPFTTTSDICNYIKYPKQPNLDLKCELDISNTIKDYVKSNLQDVMETFSGDSTKFTFFLVYSELYDYELEFEDNASLSGSVVGFYNTSITSLTGVELTVGDTILITQNLYEWDYDDNIYIVGDELGFVSTTPHSLEVGDDIIVTGQITEAYYNGATKVKTVVDAYTVSTWKTHTTSTPTEGGTIVAAIPPQYNTTATITDIYIDGVLGLVIKTDIAFARNTAPISGKIRSLTNSKILKIDSLISDLKYAYNIRLDRLDYHTIFNGYTSTAIDTFITTFGNKFISTIGYKLEYNKIEYNSKSYLLSHNDYLTNPMYMGMLFTFYDTEANLIANNPLGTSKIMSGPTDTDLYFPVGIESVINDPSRIDSVGFDLALDYLDVKYYTVRIIDISTNNTKSKRIIYKINDTCNGNLPVYHLMWKDSFGSWITYPFKYVAKKSTDVSKSSFYNREGKFVNDLGFTLDMIDRGETVFYSKSRNSYDLTSDWVRDEDNILFEDLIKSTEIYLQIPEYDNILIPVTLDNKNIEYKQETVDSLFMYSPKVIVSFNDYRF